MVCSSSFAADAVPEKNKDVLILALLIQDYWLKTEASEINLSELVKTDTLNRISTSFERIELKHKAGYISVYYKFSKLRSSKEIDLSDKEKEWTKPIRWKEKELKNQYDGEIQFNYGERFYNIHKVIVNRAPIN